MACSDYLRYIGAWETHKVDSQGHEILPSQGVEVLLNIDKVTMIMPIYVYSQITSIITLICYN